MDEKLFGKLTFLQRKQLEEQIRQCLTSPEREKLIIELGKGKTIELEQKRLVANPRIMNSGIVMARWIMTHTKIFEDKIVVDTGTGGGIIGIAAAKAGAKKVYLLDIDKNAVKLAKVNVAKHRIQDICKVIAGDLLSNLPRRVKADVHIFNFPFFGTKSLEQLPWTAMMLMPREKLKVIAENSYQNILF